MNQNTNEVSRPMSRKFDKKLKTFSLFRGFLFLLILFVFGGAQPSFGYIPPSQFIIKNWVNKHVALKPIRFKTTVIAYDKNKPTEVRFKETVVFYPDTLLVKSWASDDAERKLYAHEKKLNSLPVVSKFLLSRDLQEVIGALRDRGIAVQTDQPLLTSKTEGARNQPESESLQRWNGMVAWVVGGFSSKEGLGPQVWFEKDTFIPLRIVYSGTQDNSIYDFRFEGSRYLREFPFPRSITVEKNGEIILASQLVDLVSEADGSHSKQSSSPLTSLGFTDAGNAASSSVRELIQTYYGVFR